MSDSVRVLLQRSCAWVVIASMLGAQAAAAAGDAADAAMVAIRPEAIRADMRFLASDALEGRGTATRGYEVAATFMATHFEGMGLKPAGDGGSYFQNVPLRSAKVDEGKTTMTLIRGGKEQALTLRQDYIVAGDPLRADSLVEAPVVFVGYGVTAPGQDYDDYKGIDAKGKIVAYIAGAPNFQSALKAHYSSSRGKAMNAVAHGAIGVIKLDDPVYEPMYPFTERVRDLAFPDFDWTDKEGKPSSYHPELKGLVQLSMEATRKFFEGTGHTADEIFADAKAGKLTAFEVSIIARIHTVSTSQDAQSPNVAAILEGSDPALKAQYLVYSAHLDHLGIGEPVNGDRIYNGALDNASGSAMLLQVARAFCQMRPRPRRSILFVAVTGEEEGLLGSDYFAHYPTVPKNSMVANINVDEDLMLWPMQDVIAFGAEHSSLGEVVRRAAVRMRVVWSPDPMPEQVIFIRSDQYSFVRQGIPSVMPSPGFKSTDPAVVPSALFGEWEKNRYHQPQDDMDQPGLDFNAAAKFARFAFLCGYLVAQAPQPPRWNQGDFFGEHFAGAKEH